MSQSDVASLQDAYRAFSRGDFDVASQILAPDVEWVENGRGMPYSGIWHGREVTVQLVAGIQTFPLVSSVRTSKGRRPCLAAVAM
jgi:ketosteroid isomerase-like protein